MTDPVFKSIKAIDYTVILVRDMDAMRRFYEDVLGFELTRTLSENWLEYRVGPNTLALSWPGLMRADAPVPEGSAALQLAFRVEREAVDVCARALEARDVPILSPPTDRDFGHRTLFFRDPDGNLLEIYAEI
ncbi:VOC family protein [Thalassococcus sp. S3]|uniref:VOC family protein n=1 Tax=Thalassococcus sp. S3 TaxID=2017482 RepID=UPI00102437BB|nr:VOC family protein [Thalassococcus sp. S3]QBF32114.1 glyoxalase [Thalassococcus sp. S3]